MIIVLGLGVLRYLGIPVPWMPWLRAGAFTFMAFMIWHRVWLIWRVRRQARKRAKEGTENASR
jgi:hypothetical protein